MKAASARDDVLRLEGVSAAYGSHEVLFGVDLRVGRGEVVGLIGPNGSGKSTLVGVVSRVLRPTAGCISVDGGRIESFGRRELARRLAVVPQGARLPEGFLVVEVVRMGRTPFVGLLRGAGAEDELMVERAMKQTGVWDLADRPVEGLSGGEQQRVVLARALAQGPRVLVLDEPTSHLDLRYQAELLRTARAAAASGVGVLVVMHDLNLAARACDRLSLLSDGRVVVEGRVEEVLARPRLERVYRTEVEVFSSPGGPLVVPRV